MIVLTNPNPELRVRSVEIPSSDIASDRLKAMIVDLKRTMREENGCGIAAPQVGIHERVIIVDDGSGPKAYINPEIVSKSFATFLFEEGCLSVPGVWGMVKRHKSVKVMAIGEDGKPVKISGKGLLSVIFQHEIDHLNGVLFIDTVQKITRMPNNSIL